VSLDDAFGSFAKRVDLEDVNLMVAAIVIKDVGGNLSEVLEHSLNALAHKGCQEDRFALTSQGQKLQGRIAVLPVFWVSLFKWNNLKRWHNLFSLPSGDRSRIGIANFGGVFIKKVTIDVEDRGVA
jgi:Flp pilus assembly protein TadB